MAVPQTLTPAFEQFFNFDGEAQPEMSSFERIPTSHFQDADFLSSKPIFGDRPYPFSSLVQQPEASPTDISHLGDTSNLLSLGWQYAPFFQAQQHIPSFPKPDTKLDLTTSDLQLGRCATTRSMTTSPSSIEKASPEPQASTSPNSSEQQDKGVEATSTKQGRRRDRRSRKRKNMDPDSPVELEKRSKFLERNRVAASKCRQKKKEWAADLDTRVRELQINKDSLSSLTNSLKEEVLYLKGEMLKHSTCNCPEVKAYLQNQLGDITGRSRKCSHCKHATDKDNSLGKHRFSIDSSNADDDSSSIALTTSTSSCPFPPSPSASSTCVVDDELEALLMEELTQDTSDDGIAKRIGR